MNTDLYIYEGGSLTYLNRIGKIDEALEWRQKIDNWAEDNNVKTFNPAKNFIREITYGYSGKLIVDQNDFFLNKATLMIVQLEYIDFSPGTMYEMITFKNMGKPIIAFGKEKHWSPHLDSCISQYCYSIDETIEIINNMFL